MAAAARQPVAGEDDPVELVLGHPRGERRIGTAGENGERRPRGHGSKCLARVAQLDLRLTPHPLVVRSRPTPSTASQGPCLRRERDDRHLCARFGHFGRLAQRSHPAGALLEDDENALGPARGRFLIAVDPAVFQRGVKPAHVHER